MNINSNYFREVNDYKELLKSVGNVYKSDFDARVENIRKEYRSQIFEIKDEYLKTAHDDRNDLTIDMNKIQK